MLQDQIANEIASNKVYLQGNDIHGRTVFVVLAKQQEMGRAEETKRFICYTLDNAIAAADPARNELRQFLCLFDLSGLQRHNCMHEFALIVIEQFSAPATRDSATMLPQVLLPCHPRACLQSA